MAYTRIDSETSPIIVAVHEDVMYASAAGHSSEMEALLKKDDLAPIFKVRVGMGIAEG